MFKTDRIKALAVFLALFLGVVYLVAYKDGRGTALAQGDDVVAKGRYLANLICVECHTVRVEGNPYQLDSAKLFAGGEPFDLGPVGVVYASNITSDKESGIGGATEEQLIRTMKDGIGIDGRKLVIMPWEIFRGLSDEDLRAMAAYMKTIPAVRNQVPSAKLNAPREALYAEALKSPAARQPAPAGFTAPTGKDNAQRGEYLARNLLGCAVCHAVNLAGGIPPFFARNTTIDKETGIGLWTKEEIVRSLREGLRPTGLRRSDPDRPPREQVEPGLRALSPLMPSRTAYVNLSDDDVYNVIAYLQSAPAVRREQDAPNPDPLAFPPPPPGPPPTLPATLPRTGGWGLEDGTPGWWLLSMVLVGGVLTALGLTLRQRRA